MEDNKEIPKVIYAPYIPMTSGTIINGIKVWDHRWWVNIWCRINWFFHLKERRRWNKLKNQKVSAKYYQEPLVMKFNIDNSGNKI